ncbi:MAG: hypothetical protein GC204_10590 [Chloroflexi bacterium]|nr:hypothetical protein [Chloroflexota bacterium]
MTSILRTLRESDPALLLVLAEVWGVTLDETDDIATRVDTLNRAMLDSERAERVWDGLSDGERAALQMLISVKGKMPEAKFERVFGSIRRLSAAVIQREQPHKHPETTAEGLYYRGLISHAFENADTGPRTIIYIPDDLVKILPAHKTSYDKLEAETDTMAYPAEEVAALDTLEEVENIQQADTSIVDDLTTLLAYLQLNNPLLQNDSLDAKDEAAISPFLLTSGTERLAFMIGLAASADLIEVQAGRALPKRAEARRWLSANRADQVKFLAESWRDATRYVDLWHVPGLYPELEAGTMRQYNPAAARGAVFEIMQHALPAQAWWSLDDFILLVHEDSADFQRPNGDFDSWYIRNDQGEYLTGLQSWNAVEGALLEFMLLGPMHWLGLLDLAEEAARLTAYGRAFLTLSAWPNPPEQADKIEVQNDGTILMSRKVPRIDRFQLARFTSWESAGGTYSYRLDPPGIERAARQGINVGHIGAFITRALGETSLPPSVARLLDNWKTGPTAQVSVERLLVLRTTAPETLDFILETPGIRRFMGARLGPMAVIVRADDVRDLRDALGEHGIQAEIAGL